MVYKSLATIQTLIKVITQNRILFFYRKRKGYELGTIFIFTVWVTLYSLITWVLLEIHFITIVNKCYHIKGSNSAMSLQSYRITPSFTYIFIKLNCYENIVLEFSFLFIFVYHTILYSPVFDDNTGWIQFIISIISQIYF